MDGSPKRGAHLHYTAGQMQLFAQHSIALFTQALPTPLVKDESDPVWVCWCAHIDYWKQLQSHEFSHASILHLDRLIYRHQMLFKATYSMWKPKMEMVTHFPTDIGRGGPVVQLSCMRFEAMNQVLKRIAEGGNYMNVPKRMVTFWMIKSALQIKSGSASMWGDTSMVSGEDAETVGLGRHGQEFADCVLSQLHVNERSLAVVHKLYHLGNYITSHHSWILTRVLLASDDTSLRLARVATILHDAEGGVSDYYLQLWLYPCGVCDPTRDFVMSRESLVAESRFHCVHLEEVVVLPLMCLPGAGDDVYFTVQYVGA